MRWGLFAGVAGYLWGDVIRAYFLAGSLETLVFDSKINIGDVGATECVPFLQKISRQYIVKNAAIVLGYLFFSVRRDQPSVFGAFQEAFPEVEDCCCV